MKSWWKKGKDLAVVKEHRVLAGYVSHSKAGFWWGGTWHSSGVSLCSTLPLFPHTIQPPEKFHLEQWATYFYDIFFLQATVCPFCANRPSIHVTQLVPMRCIFHSSLVTFHGQSRPRNVRMSQAGSYLPKPLCTCLSLETSLLLVEVALT